MARRAGVSPLWIKERKAEVVGGRFTSTITSYNPAAQWLITFLAKNNMPVKVTNLGAGVKRITLAEHVCPTCKGKGFVKKEVKTDEQNVVAGH